jgi:vancomycin resistance protein YoaR
VKRQIITLTLGLAAAPLLVAQQPARQQAQQQQQQQMQSQQALRMQQRMQETSQRMARTMTQIRDMNQWMTQRQSCDACRQMGRDMEQMGDRLTSMVRQLDQLHKDPTLTGDQDRLRDMDRLHDRMRDMIHQLDEARESLRLLAGK